jgi:hypothetical protein
LQEEQKKKHEGGSQASITNVAHSCPEDRRYSAQQELFRDGRMPMTGREVEQRRGLFDSGIIV